ncbi:hypothetical protein [Azospirillum brasilense]|uniref:hypothetical protein n=1 Tax=Azospirillum brasilense TaxID=192 RepID=UPI00039FB2D7|nr:hypothetical protein [Azospirillum brasilense]
MLNAAGQPERRPLRLGVSDGSMVEVVEGKLEVGDRVVLGETAPSTASGAVPSMGAGPRM